MANNNPFIDQVSNANKATQAWKFTSILEALIIVFLTYSLVASYGSKPTVLVPYGFATGNTTAEVSTSKDLAGTSSDYLASLAIADLNLILNVTPDDADVQVNRFLKRLTPDLYGAQSSTLLAMGVDLRKAGMSQAFYPLETKISKDGSTVEVSGTQIGYVGGKEVSHNNVVYIIKYKMYKGYFHVADLRPKNS